MLDKILKEVSKPTRYTGGELNSVVKDPKSVKVRHSFWFPDVYEVAMSHLGLKILYHMMNERPDTWCERCFTPWPDMEEKMREYHLPLFSLESGEDVKCADFIGITLQYEMCYSNILNMLELAEIPLLSNERGDTYPIVYAGGPCAYNPEPLADFIDFFVMGEGEAQTNEILDLYIAMKEEGRGKEEFLLAVSKIKGVYVPRFYDVSYHDDGTIASFSPNREGIPETVQKRIMPNLDESYYPDRVIVPFMEVIHDRIMLEIFRGCIRGCRFCQAGMIYRPVREKSVNTLLCNAKNLIDHTGYEEISLTSLSSSDYTDLAALTDGLLKITVPERVNLALPSLRVDNFSLELMQKVQKVRKSGLTFAPEAGTQRMRDVINKNITEENLMESSLLAFRGGYNGMKLYFMIGLPYETMEDVAGIADLSEKVVGQFFSIPKPERPKGGVSLTISVSSFVPKAHTPFQWARQDSMDELREKQMHLARSIHSKHIRYNWHESKVSVLEGVFARGDRKLSKVLLRAHELGCKFDGWNEYFNSEAWQQAFDDTGVDPSFYTRAREYDEILPWDFIDIGVTRAFLMRENEKAKTATTTPNCREKCSGCGAARLEGGCPIA